MVGWVWVGGLVGLSGVSLPCTSCAGLRSMGVDAEVTLDAAWMLGVFLCAGGSYVSQSSRGGLGLRVRQPPPPYFFFFLVNQYSYLY